MAGMQVCANNVQKFSNLLLSLASFLPGALDGIIAVGVLMLGPKTITKIDSIQGDRGTGMGTVGCRV